MNMFRSLANLTAHKRSYCFERFRDVNHAYSSKISTEAAQLQTVVIEAEPIETVIKEPDWNIENYSPSLQLLKDAGILQDIEEKPVINRLIPPSKKSLNNVVSNLAAKLDGNFYKEAQDKVNAQKKLTKTEGVCLEPMTQSNNAKFQSWTTGFEYKEVQTLKNSESTVIIGPTGQELPKGDMNGALDRSKSPTSSEGSKENIDTSLLDDSKNSEKSPNISRYPCPECKKGFSKVKNVYNHLKTIHGRTQEEYLKMKKVITENAYVVEVPKTEQLSVQADAEPQDFEFKKSTKKEKSLQLALAVGLVNRNGIGMQKINKPAAAEEPLAEKTLGAKVENIEKNTLGEKVENIEKKSEEENIENIGCAVNDKLNLEVKEKTDIDRPRARGRPRKDAIYSDYDSDNEISSKDYGPVPSKKRKRAEAPETNYNCGDFTCHLCEKSYKTPTFLLQHYISHYKADLKRDFGESIRIKKMSHVQKHI